MVDKMLMSYQKKKENEFIKEGGIRERMTAVRIKYRNDQNQALEVANNDIATLQKENTELKIIIADLQKEIEYLKNK